MTTDSRRIIMIPVNGKDRHGDVDVLILVVDMVERPGPHLSNFNTNRTDEALILPTKVLRSIA